MYIFKGNRLEIPVQFHSFKGMTEERALVNSDAMENFIDHSTIKRLKLGTKKLMHPILVQNIDGIQNRAGHITHFLNLILTKGNKKVPSRFYITNLGKDQVILGYLWLSDFNPDIDWPTSTLKGPAVGAETPFFSRFPTLRRIMEQRRKAVIPTLDHPLDNIKVRVVETSKNKEEDLVNKAIEANIVESLDVKANTSNDQPTPEDLSCLPPEYNKFAPIFMKPIAGQLPPHCPWDLKVRLILNAPLSLTCHPYQLSQPEQIFQEKYIAENLAQGFIRESTSPYATPVFYKKKKDGTYRPLFDYWKLNTITIKNVSPLPRIDTIMEDVAGMVCFSSFDLQEGYYNLAVKEESQDLLAFKMTQGLYAPMVMPFGPTNCLAAMQ